MGRASEKLVSAAAFRVIRSATIFGMMTEKLQWMLKTRIDVYEADGSDVATVSALDYFVGMTGIVLTGRA